MCQSQTRPKCTILGQKIKKNLTFVAHQTFWVSPWGRKKDLAEGSQSLSKLKHGTCFPAVMFNAVLNLFRRAA